jgi:hypothetical protein
MNQRKAGLWLTRIGLALFAIRFGSCVGLLAALGERGGPWLTLLTGSGLLGLVLLIAGLTVSFLSRR